MAYADPQSVTINAVPVSLPRTGLALTQGEFRSTDGQTRLSISHPANGRRNRHIVKVQSEAIVSDPLVPAQNVPVSYSAHVVVDVPRQGVTALQAQKLAEALSAWCTAANLAKLVAGES